MDSNNKFTIYIKGLLLAYILVFSLTFAEFVDLQSTHPNYHAILSLQSKNIVEGYDKDGESFFYPSKIVNRAEALKILMLSADIKIIENDPQQFPDVPFSAWFSPYVNTASVKKIVKGFNDGKFYPEAQVTQAEFLKMVIKSFEFPSVEKKEDDEWFEPFVRLARKFRLISGNDQSPHEALTRGEVAEIIFRAQWIKDKKFKEKYIYAGNGTASYYNNGFAGKPTASGEIYDPMALTAAHRTLPFGTRLKVWNEAGDVVFVRINDRGPYHENRILDLSEKAFKNLATISEGVVDVYFEVYTDPADENFSIPENIRSNLSSEVKDGILPDVIQDNLSEVEPSIIPEIVTQHITTDPSIYEHKPQKLEKIKIQPLFEEGLNNLAPEFFDKAVLRRTIPQKIVKGSIIRLAGTVKDGRFKKAIFFLENIKTGKQKHFEGIISGKNFDIPVKFLDEGEFHLGLVFDDQSKSKIAKIQVVNMPKKHRLFPASDIAFIGKEFSIEVKPEKEEVFLNWESNSTRITKITFSQKEKTKDIYIEDGMESASIPYEFFHEFLTGENLAIDFYQAMTKNANLQEQTTNWKKGPFGNFDLTFGFPDTEKDSIGIPKFPRFMHELKPITLNGEIFNDVKFADNIFVINANGEVSEFPLTVQGDSFKTRITPLTWGPHIIEIISDQGEILFNRAIYFYPNEILPIFPWKQTAVKSNTRGATLAWINYLRGRQKKPLLTSSVNLDRFAQLYADEMADNDFISHTDILGRNFQERIKAWGLQGGYGENLSYGSTFELALEGLENSASHRKNLLEKKWKRAGIGIAQNRKGDYYVVQLFGR